MKGKFKNAGTHIILIIASFISVFPLYWMIAAATNNSTDVLGGKLSLGTNFIQNLMKLTEMQNVSRAFCNSLFYSTILSVLSLDRKSTRLNSSHNNQSRMPSSA